ncbi:hypothetical protein M569_11703 [Genlisea aurea]|uniref:PWWP domain-containing protein n=1 Tax=Genlisea aurea TaxID=192259 RepID=S8C8G0_9LAMI|nr:hypothetical protein M569_11703 [Genlisea aurea]
MSSDTETAVVDCNVGSIVWVRRRNGSWWPGEILDPKELPASHFASRRSGTPVKLLGREDPSVDWYNLEKSKRVKSFCCDEFYDFIERAEAAGRMPPKKRGKYASESERKSMEKTRGKSESSAVAYSDPLGNGGGSKRNDALETDHQHSSEEMSPSGGIRLSREDGGARFGIPRRAKKKIAMDSVKDSRTSSSPMEMEPSRIEESAYRADIGEDHHQVSETDSPKSDSDAEKNRLSDSSAFVELHPKYPRRNDDHGSISSSDGVDCSATTGGGVSKWPVKCRRSKLPRNSAKRAAENFFDFDSDSGVSQDYDGARWSSKWNRSFVSRLIMPLDVELRVDGNSYRRNVSMVSTTSKLNGHAIVGHPVPVEPLEAGSTDSLVSISDGFSPVCSSSRLSSGWRTRRRTAKFRVPRPFSSSKHGGRKKAAAQSKASRKVRSLSSIPAEGDCGDTKKIVVSAICGDGDDDDDVDDDGGGGMVRNCGKTAAVACIPVNLVFTRLQEELFRQLQNQ